MHFCRFPSLFARIARQRRAFLFILNAPGRAFSPPQHPKKTPGPLCSGQLRPRDGVSAAPKALSSRASRGALGRRPSGIHHLRWVDYTSADTSVLIARHNVQKEGRPTHRRARAAQCRAGAPDHGSPPQVRLLGRFCTCVGLGKTERF